MTIPRFPLTDGTELITRIGPEKTALLSLPYRQPLVELPRAWSVRVALLPTSYALRPWHPPLMDRHSPTTLLQSTVELSLVAMFALVLLAVRRTFAGRPLFALPTNVRLLSALK